MKIECRECRKIVDGERGQVFCSRHCARLAQARFGIPSHEEKALLLDAVAAKVDELFGERKK